MTKIILLLVIVAINVIGIIAKHIAKKKEEERQAELKRQREAGGRGAPPTAVATGSVTGLPNGPRDEMIARRQAQLEELRRRREAAATVKPRPQPQSSAERFQIPDAPPPTRQQPDRVRPAPIAIKPPTAPVSRPKAPSVPAKAKAPARPTQTAAAGAAVRLQSSASALAKKSVAALASSAPRTRSPIAEMITPGGGREALRRAVILSEVLGAPVCLRLAQPNDR